MASNLSKTFLALLGPLILVGCGSKSFDTKEELWTYLKNTENGYHQVKTVNGIEYSLTYKPTDLLVHQELGKNYSVDKVKALRTKYKDHLYFNLSMSADGQELLSKKVGNRAAFGAMVQQLAFRMDKKVHLIGQNKDTLSLLDYVYPRMYGMSNSTDMLLVYQRNSETMNEDYLRFTLEDIGFGSGEIGFKLLTQKIENQPKLSF